jgi:putative tryptophan/tyrosine transport system substrate-binding protein
MNRRDAVLVLLGLGAVPVAAVGQPAAKPARIALLGYGSPETTGIYVEYFKEGLRDLGYIEGRDFVFEPRWALGKPERLPDLAKELLALKPDVIVVQNPVTALAAQQATTTIPIVMAGFSDPVGMGLVKSLARPGGNITGLSSHGSDFSPKLLELLLTVLPTLSRVAILYSPDAAGAALKNLLAAAQTMRVNILMLEVRTLAEIENAFTRMARESIRAVIVLTGPLFFVQKRQVVEFAIENRIPSVFMYGDFPDAGGLMGYGPDLADAYRREATYVDKILKGARPGDLPIEQPTKFELVINLKTAKALGLTIPQSVLLRADRVIN